MTAPSGLTEQQARERLQRDGPNELREEGQKSLWRIAWEQLTGLLVLVLLGAAAVSAFLKDYKDAVVILAIVLFNAALGVLQEYRAEKAIAALKRLATPQVRVRRDNRIMTIPSRDIVPGDIIYLETGNVVPADCRLLDSTNLRTQESVLTGEAVPVEKDPRQKSHADTPVADRQDMVFQGTIVVHGRAVAQVEQTGMKTQLGHIAASVQKVQSEMTPLQKRLDQVARRLVVVIFIIAVAVFALGIRRGENASLMFLTAVSIAVAAIPESLPAVVAIALALGAKRMLKHKALVRKLSAVETLGSVTVICTDKTGTLTENRMTVTALDIAGHRLELEEDLKTGHPVMRESAAPNPALEKQPTLALLLTGSALCNDAALTPSKKNSQEFEASGEPTEAALVVAAAHFGLWKEKLDHLWPRVGEVAFDSERKRMSTLHRLQPRAGDAALKLLPPEFSHNATGQILFVKGSVESLVQVSQNVWNISRAEPMTDSWKKRVYDTTHQLAREGMRVLAVAYRQWPGDTAVTHEAEVDLTFIGLLALHDPPRTEVKEALRQCHEAGISVHMVTGDHPTTAQAIAEDLGMRHHRVLTGSEIHVMSVEELAKIIEEVPIFARVAPEQKLKIVEALKRRGHVVAMTGDGVNDAPALKRADIGIAMGIAGTDVSREAADMVLLDDNFATIVTAIQEGRTIYDNIRKFANYLLTTNAAEIGTMLLGPLLGMPIPLLPLQILWINLITDGPPALALGVEPTEPDVMQRRPRAPSESLIDRDMTWRIASIGCLMIAVSLGPGWWAWKQDTAHWQTLLFTILVFAQMAHVLAIHSGEQSIFKRASESNWPLYLAVFGVAASQLLVVYAPFAQGLLRTRALPISSLLMAVGLGFVILLAIEVEKWLHRRRHA